LLSKNFFNLYYFGLWVYENILKLFGVLKKIYSFVLVFSLTRGVANVKANL